MSEIKVNKITPKQNCTQVTLGDSGDTFVIPSGVTITNNGTQTGFGRTGTVNWDTTAKTASFTAVSGNGYFVNTTSGAITVTMPASPSAGDIVGIKDYAGTFSTNNVTVGRNGSNFDGSPADATLLTDQLSVFFVYVDGTQGWKATQNDSGSYGAQYVTATGGTISYCGDYKIHTFTGPGTFCVSCAGNPAGSNTVDYLVVAGGGAGSAGGTSPTTNGGGGGGAGGYRESSGTASGCYTVSPLGACVSALPVTVQGYPVVVGGGAPTTASSIPKQGGNGSNSVFSTITSTGGGGGGCGTNNSPTNPAPGNPGGSGGGTGWGPSPTCRPGGAGNTPPVSPPQGNPGGNNTGGNGAGGGGGGATQAGTNSPNPGPSAGKPGGDGATSSINGTPTTRAGGGGGGKWSTGCFGAGGAGGGGNGGVCSPGSAGTINTGGGGGGAGAFGPESETGGAGGSGIVIIRYKYQ